MGLTENELHKSIVYQVKIQGRLRENWADWFNSESVWIYHPDEGSNDTAIIVSVPDQAALRGVLNKIWDLNLSVISLDLYQVEAKAGGTNEY